ncbi:uncharacterized protein LOC109808962 [Cajanus cajan]|uniref:Transmembrane protein n=1 Tax=Cajanus cajan TaxID=3821 RepID=A0A151SPV0_CAJCA|nr:uncharacterized protein LOC109808962 [Cajanus cajan]KYP56805.1 hypothetical protein KK1_003053 [Cajanus cajan]
MTSIISQGLVLTTAMLLSTTLFYVAFSWHKATPSSFQIHHPNKPTLRSCLYSEEKKRERKKKKKVKFAENVKDGRERNEEKRVSRNCRHETSESSGMQANRMALYNGILRDRVHRMECSY